MGGLGFIRLGVWQNFIRAWRSGYQGNMNGEGFILGGVFVVGAGDQVEQHTCDSVGIRGSECVWFLTCLSRLQGVLLEHREKEFGNKVDPAEVLEAAKRIAPHN